MCCDSQFAPSLLLIKIRRPRGCFALSPTAPSAARPPEGGGLSCSGRVGSDDRDPPNKSPSALADKGGSGVLSWGCLLNKPGRIQLQPPRNSSTNQIKSINTARYECSIVQQPARGYASQLISSSHLHRQPVRRPRSPANAICAPPSSVPTAPARRTRRATPRQAHRPLREDEAHRDLRSRCPHAAGSPRVGR